MARILTLCVLIISPTLSHAHNYGCASVGASMESFLFDAIAHDLKIDISEIQRDKTIVNVIETNPVSRLYAKSLAKMDHATDQEKGRNSLSEGDYFSGYYENHATSITARYVYINKLGKKDIFITSSLMNQDECSIRFNGYITLSREF